MKPYYLIIAFVLAVATAYAVSQTPSSSAAPPNAQQQTGPSSPASTMPDQPAATGDQDTPHPGAQDQQKNPNGAANPTPSAGAESSSAAGTDDAALQTQIQHQLAGQNLSTVSVEVQHGVVKLTGSVPTKEDRKRAKELAKNVPGVKKVSEKLSVNPNATSASSASAPQNTAGSIAGNAGSTQAPVTSTTAPSTSTQAQQSGGVSGSTSATTTGSGMPQSSTGSIGSNAEAGGAASGAATATESPDDSELQSKIDGAIKNEPTLSSANVTTHVTADTIELSGTVASSKDKTTAQRIAQSFAGNRKVVDKIAIGSGNPAVQQAPPK